jgi:predicted lipoprotein with Yx(FWY)xxD motif
MAKGRRTNGEGSIYKRKDGRWTAQYVEDGKKVYFR